MRSKGRRRPLKDPGPAADVDSTASGQDPPEENLDQARILRAQRVVVCDRWTDPLVGADLDPASAVRVPPSSVPTCWVVAPEESGGPEVVALWVHRAIATDPHTKVWVRDDLPAMLTLLDPPQRPQSVESVSDLLGAAFVAEGGVEVAGEVTAQAAEMFARELAAVAHRPIVVRDLPDGQRIEAVAIETTQRSPVVTLAYPGSGGVESMVVLRDGRLGRLAELADRLAERYLVPAAEIVGCVLADQPPRLESIRLGLRFRSFEVDGVPVTATSRVVLEVDPHLDAANLARTFARWQKAAGVEQPKSSSKLVALASELVGRLRLVPADRLTDSGSHPAELFGVGARSWRLVPVLAWSALARQVDVDPRLIRNRAAAIVRLLLPLDGPHQPRWLPPYPVHSG